jgi:hypothetical protein
MDSGLINVGKYSDGSWPVATVRFDVTSDTCKERIWIEANGQNWIAVDAEFADELCRAIKRAAKHIRASLPHDGGE